MAWFVFAGGRRIPLVDGITVTIGRDGTCDLTVDGGRVSRRHLSVALDGDGSYVVTDTSANGTFGSDGRLTSERSASQSCYALGGTDGPVVVISDAPDLDVAAAVAAFQPGGPAEELHAATSETTGIILSGVTRYGRAKDNDVVLTGALASAHHAHVRRSDESVEIFDLASERGTFVNGLRVTRQSLRPGDHVSMGGSAFVVADDGTLAPQFDTSGASLEARDVSVSVGTARLLNDVSFHLPARSVLAVVGPSGSGKSTLLGGLTGFAPATRGSVEVGGRDLYAEYDDLRFDIGLVPQQDLVPAQLRVRDALDYAARLRFPKDTSAAERAARVDEVLAELGLAERADLRIDRLSGGQRKRVSVALEMLTKPSLLFLDEPTSGLDPGLDRQVMILLRELADAGRTVVVVTHSVENLALADYLLVLAAGGYVAYFGPPADAPAYFGVADMPSVFLALDAAPGPEWQRRWNDSRHATSTRGGAVAAAAPPSPSGAPVAAGSGASMRVSRPRGTWSQFVTLTSRNIKVIASDRTYAALLLVLPLVLAATGFLVGSAAGLAPDAEQILNPEARLLLMVLVLGSVFTGAATSIQELVKDRVIYQRERAVGLSRFAYISSKALVLGVIAALQGLVFALLSLVGRPGPEFPLAFPGTFDIAFAVAAGTVASCMLGLVLSGFLPSRDAALPALVIATMVQVVFSGAIPLRFNALLDLIGWMMPAYWEFRAMASSVGLDVLIGTQGDAIWPAEAGQWWLSIVVLGVMSLVFIAVAIKVSGRHDPGRKRRS